MSYMRNRVVTTIETDRSTKLELSGWPKDTRGVGLILTQDPYDDSEVQQIATTLTPESVRALVGVLETFL